MIPNNIEVYIENLIPKRSDLVMEMENYAKEQQVPIMELVGIETLIQLLKIHNPKSILEIGTAIGYSAIRIAEALPSSVIVTIERDEERFQRANEYIERAGLNNRIETVLEDALDLNDDFAEHSTFDALFIDAAKGQYKRFFEKFHGLVRPGGIIISDNILFRGFVADEPDEKRLKSLAKKINSYNEWLMNHDGYETVIFPVGDGVAVSIKK